MDWHQDGDTLTATGQYDRAYKIVPENGRYRAQAQTKSRTFATVADAKHWCEYEEREMRKG